MNRPASLPPAFIGLDAGGTQTRWAVADAAGDVCAEGHAAGLSALQLQDTAGRAALVAVLREIAAAAGPVQAAVAGVTGFDSAQAPALQALLAAAFGIDAGAVLTLSDIELACRAAFAPGEGLVLIAGTGSIAAFIDAAGTLRRAGGRGVVIDDAGGGHWIARKALRQVWRAEDERAGAGPPSALARRVFEHIGGSDWAQTRQWVYGAGSSRGQIGTLALAVAAAADEDPAALAILQAAGTELARLARVLLQRFGPRPVALAGRVFALHPIIRAQLQQGLPAGTPIHRLLQGAHLEAAQMARRKFSR